MILQGDTLAVLRTLPSESVHCCVTSPPYFGLRSYLPADHPLKPLEIGREKTPDEYVAKLVEVFREVRRVLRKDGTLWLNLGDSYAANRSYQVPSTKGGPKHGQAHAVGGAADSVLPGLKPKDLIGIPWMVAFALRADGWYLRQDNIWRKPNPMPESVRDRFTKAHEYVFLLSKSGSYYWNFEAAQVPATGRPPGNTKPTKNGRHYADGASEHRTAANLHRIGARETANRRSVLDVTTKPFKGAHFATFPPDLIEPLVEIGTPPDGTVLDPFGGAGTVELVAKRLGRKSISIELNPEFVALAQKRVGEIQHWFLDLL